MKLIFCRSVLGAFAACRLPPPNPVLCPKFRTYRSAAVAESDRLKRRSRALDEAYSLIRARHYRQAADAIGVHANIIAAAI